MWVKAAQNRFRETHAKAFENWAEYRRNKRVVEEEVNARVFGREPYSDAVRASLEELRKSAASRAPVIRDGQFSGPPVFHVGPGLNIIGPPYDIGLVVALGSNAPSVQTSVASGVFGVVATATARQLSPAYDAVVRQLTFPWLGKGDASQHDGIWDQGFRGVRARGAGHLCALGHELNRMALLRSFGIV